MVTSFIKIDSDSTIKADLAKGALAGAAGAVAMDRVGWWMMRRERIEVLQREAQARPYGMDPAHMIVNRVAHIIGKDLKPDQPHPAGIAMFFALAMLPAAFYGVLLNRVHKIGFGRGLVYGLALFLIMDEWMPSRLGLANKSSRYPWQTHWKGLVSHLTLGVVTYVSFRVLNGLLSRRF